MVIALDAGPLGLVTNPGGSDETRACADWLMRAVRQGSTIVVPEIADYEIRRELLRANRDEGVRRLDAFEAETVFLPISTAAMREAARLWADARNAGRQTADDKALDADVILAAQLITFGAAAGEFVLATTNVGHLTRYLVAKHWKDIAVD